MIWSYLGYGVTCINFDGVKLLYAQSWGIFGIRFSIFPDIRCPLINCLSLWCCILFCGCLFLVGHGAEWCQLKWDLPVPWNVNFSSPCLTLLVLSCSLAHQVACILQAVRGWERILCLDVHIFRLTTSWYNEYAVTLCIVKYLLLWKFYSVNLI